MDFGLYRAWIQSTFVPVQTKVHFRLELYYGLYELYYRLARGQLGSTEAAGVSVPPPRSPGPRRPQTSITSMLLTVTRLSLSHTGLPSQSVGVWGVRQKIMVFRYQNQTLYQ
jgi:hypothetical protein